MISAYAAVAAFATAWAGAEQWQCDWWSVDGGGGAAAGGSWSMVATIGQADAGTLAGGSWQLDGGFWPGPAQADACVGDVNRDGVVNGADLGMLLGAWGTADRATDLDGNGTVNGADLGMLLGAWGACP